MSLIYTIGYATKPIEVFIAQLKRYSIDVVADVRSVPYSKAFPDFHQEAISSHLRDAGLKYVYLGKEWGPRSTDPNHYDQTGQVRFDRLMKSAPFASGIQRINTGVEKGYSVALIVRKKIRRDVIGVC